MLNYKQVLYGLLILAMAGCKPAKYTVNHTDLINNSFKKDSYFLANYESKKQGTRYNNVTSYRIYRATIKEELVENNSVGEYKLINEESEQVRINKPMTGNYHELYLYLFNINSGSSKKFAMVSAGYNAKGECISLGPAYTGSINTGKSNPSLHAEYSVKIKHCKKSLYLYNNYKNKTSLDFLSHTAVMPNTNPDSLLQFYMVLQNKRNKIGGINKPLIFNIARIFNDSAALTFRLIAEKK